MPDDKLAIFSSATDREGKTVKSRKLTCVVALMLFAVPTALATTTFYVNGLTGNDRNNCLSASTACKTIGHAILRAASGGSISVGSATYKENLSIGKNLRITGAGAITTIVDGGGGRTSGFNSPSGQCHSVRDDVPPWPFKKLLWCGHCKLRDTNT